MPSAVRLVSPKDFHAIRVLAIVTVFTWALWDMLEEFGTWLEEKTGAKKWQIHLAIGGLALVIILLDPYTFENLL
jgi:hypothetical protein